MNKKAGKFFMALGVLLIAAAAVLFVYNSRENKNAGEQSESILSQLDALIEGSSETGDTPESESASDDVYGSAAGGMQAVMISSYEYIGKLTFPTLALELPVMAQWDYTRLKLAPCLYYGSVQEDNMVIAGHNYTSHFGKLSNLRMGDAVIFTDMNGDAYVYSVADIEQLGAYDTKEMLDSGWQLSLYTCDYSGTNRITVRCTR